MKKIIMLLATVGSTLTLSLTAFAQTPPATPAIPDKEVQIGINDAFVPGSFDSTADAYVVVNGVFQNGCYKWNRAEIANVDAFNHEIKSIATVTQGMCIMVLVPFQKDVRLGKLSSGKHTLKFLSGDGTYMEKSLNIE